MSFKAAKKGGGSNMSKPVSVQIRVKIRQFQKHRVNQLYVCVVGLCMLHQAATAATSTRMWYPVSNVLQVYRSLFKRSKYLLLGVTCTSPEQSQLIYPTAFQDHNSLSKTAVP